jgi:regulatory protein
MDESYGGYGADKNAGKTFEQVNEAIIKSLRLLSYGAKSRRKLIQKLMESGFDEDVAEQAVLDMEDRGYIDDAKMAADYVAYAVESKAYGRYRVIQGLTEKGVCRELAENAYNNYIDEHAELTDDGEEVDIDLENAAATLEKRMRQTRLDIDELDEGDIRRLTGYLHRRGFSFNTINKAFNKIRDDN